MKAELIWEEVLRGRVMFVQGNMLWNEKNDSSLKLYKLTRVKAPHANFNVVKITWLTTEESWIFRTPPQSWTCLNDIEVMDTKTVLEEYFIDLL